MLFQFLHRIAVACFAQSIRLLVRWSCGSDLVLLNLFIVFTWYVVDSYAGEPHIKRLHRMTTKDLAATDFYSSRKYKTSKAPRWSPYSTAFGVVLRFSPVLLVEAVEWPVHNADGEWGPLQFSNWLLNQRFGRRKHPYVAHIPKVMSRAHFAEASSIWSKEFLDTSEHRFRGGRDVYSAFLLTHLVVERAREIMLWSWIVGTIGADDDTWGTEESEKAWKILGGDESTEEIRVTLPQRATLSPERLESLFQEAGEEPPKETEYLLCECCISPLNPSTHHPIAGMDAFPYGMLNGLPLQQWPRVSDGNHTNQEQFSRHSWANCKVVREKCFGSRKQASAVFKHVAFDATECGDCSTHLDLLSLVLPLNWFTVINALLRASGAVGLSAFLPPAERVYPPSDIHNPPIPIPGDAPVLLPLTNNWKTTDFTLHSRLRAWSPVHVREWVLRVFSRYNYVVGTSSSLPC